MRKRKGINFTGLSKREANKKAVSELIIGDTGGVAEKYDYTLSKSKI